MLLIKSASASSVKRHERPSLDEDLANLRAAEHEFQSWAAQAQHSAERQRQGHELHERRPERRLAEEHEL